jgi:hypothetical protein
VESTRLSSAGGGGAVRLSQSGRRAHRLLCQTGTAHLAYTAACRTPRRVSQAARSVHHSQAARSIRHNPPSPLRQDGSYDLWWMRRRRLHRPTPPATRRPKTSTDPQVAIPRKSHSNSPTVNATSARGCCPTAQAIVRTPGIPGKSANRRVGAQPPRSELPPRDVRAPSKRASKPVKTRALSDF